MAPTQRSKKRSKWVTSDTEEGPPQKIAKKGKKQKQKQVQKQVTELSSDDSEEEVIEEQRGSSNVPDKNNNNAGDKDVSERYSLVFNMTAHLYSLG
jgi:hypothetical protein